MLWAIPADAYRHIKGKSAGYRLVYQVESPTNVLLLTIYSKSDRDDVSSAEILNILDSIAGDDE
jgi:hypothetical protein